MVLKKSNCIYNSLTILTSLKKSLSLHLDMNYFKFLLMVLVLSACNSTPDNIPSLTDIKAIETKTENTQQEIKEVKKPLEGDPSFIEPKEAISVDGPDNITRNLIQDRNGNFWFASWCGIIKYDGKVFTNYTVKENLERFHALSLMEDKAGHIWIGTVQGGLYRFDGSSFTRYTIKDGLASNLVYCIFEDNKGLLWIGTNNGVSIYDGKTFANYTTDDGLTHNVVNTIIQDNNGIIWLGTKRALCYHVPSASVTNGPVKIIKKEGPFADVRLMYKDKIGRIWMGTAQSGVLCYDNKLPDGIGKGKAFSVFTNKDGLSDDFVTCITEDTKGNLWFGGDICFYDGKKFTPLKIKEVQNSTNVFCVYGDKNGNIWIANASGVLRYDGKNFEDFRTKTKTL